MNRKLRKLRPEKAALRRCPFIPSQIVRNLQSYHFPTCFKGKLSGKPYTWCWKNSASLSSGFLWYTWLFSNIYPPVNEHCYVKLQMCHLLIYIDFRIVLTVFLANCNKLPECKTINIHQYSWNSHDSPYVFQYPVDIDPVKPMNIPL